MEDQIISFETAKLAKEKGFNIDTEECYSDETKITSVSYGDYLAPTQSLLQKWLREVYNIIVTSNPITGFGKIEYNYNIYTFSNILSLTEMTARRFNTYEKSLEEALQEGLKLILKIDKNDNSKR